MNEKKKRNQYKFDKEKYDHIHLQTPKGKKEIIKSHARNTTREECERVCQ